MVAEELELAARRVVSSAASNITQVYATAQLVKNPKRADYTATISGSQQKK